MAGPRWSADNKEAQALIDAALAKCEGCRQSWRLRKSNGQDWQYHGNLASRILCRAQEERQQLRGIAAKARGK